MEWKIQRKIQKYLILSKKFQDLCHTVQHNPPRCIDVTPKGTGNTITLTYAMHQRYGHLGWLQLHSLLFVDVEIQQMKDSPEFNELLVTKMEEHWNGGPLFSSLLFWGVRRLNGIVSHQMTSRLLRWERQWENRSRRWRHSAAGGVIVGCCPITAATWSFDSIRGGISALPIMSERFLEWFLNDLCLFADTGDDYIIMRVERT